MICYKGKNQARKKGGQYTCQRREGFIGNRMSRKDLTEKVTYEDRSKGGEQ